MAVALVSTVNGQSHSDHQQAEIESRSFITGLPPQGLTAGRVTSLSYAEVLTQENYPDDLLDLQFLSSDSKFSKVELSALQLVQCVSLFRSQNLDRFYFVLFA